MKTILYVLFFSLLASVGSSQAAWYDGDKIAPDRPWQKAKDGLGVELFLTKNAVFFTDWASPQPPRLEMAHFAKVSEKVYSVLIFFGAGKDTNGESFVTFSGRVVDPDGKVAQEYKDARAIHGPNLTKGYDLSLSEGYMAAQFSVLSKKGPYTFELTVTDHVKNVDLTIAQKVELK